MCTTRLPYRQIIHLKRLEHLKKSRNQYIGIHLVIGHLVIYIMFRRFVYWQFLKIV